MGMNLRLRLSLLVALLTAGVLLAFGLLVRLGLEANLLRRLDAQLEHTLSLVQGLVGPDPEDQIPRFLPERSLEALPRLLPELVLVLAGPKGELLDAFGRLPQPKRLEGLAQGSLPGYRRAERPLGEGLRLVAALPLAPVEESLRALSAALWVLLPLGVLAAWGMAYALLGRGLRPLAGMTRRALELAEARDWTEPLPEPPAKDEVWALARAVNGLLAALSEVIESERRFTQDAAHALRTPLAVLLGRLERALEGAQGPLLEELLEARKGLERLLVLVERLLALARTEAGGLERRPLALDALAFEEAEALRPLFTSLALDLPEEPLWILGDEAALRAALRALLENAASHGGGRVSLRVYTGGKEAWVEVADEGPGLPPGALPHLFERFWRGPQSPSSGLGLALVAAVARWHGGRVQAQNQTKGALFRLRLPLPPPAEEGF